MPGGAAPVPCRGRAAEAIGYKLEREEPAPQQPGFGGMAFNRRQPSAAPAKPRRAKTPTEEDAQVDKLAAAFQKDMRPVGKELRKLLETPEGDLKAACNALAKRLPKMIPASPSMADALEKEMAQAVADEVTQKEALANSEKCQGCGQWLDGNGVCHDCHKADEAAAKGENPDGAKMQAAEIGKGKAAVRKCIDEKADIYDAVARSDIGTISFLYGSPVDTEGGKAHGLSHLREKHGNGMLDVLPTALIRGKIRNPDSNGNKIAIDYGDYQVHLAKSFARKWKPTVKVTWVVTGFKANKDGAE